MKNCFSFNKDAKIKYDDIFYFKIGKLYGDYYLLDINILEI